MSCLSPDLPAIGNLLLLLVMMDTIPPAWAFLLVPWPLFEKPLLDHHNYVAPDSRPILVD
jgi:hypothetical protein